MSDRVKIILKLVGFLVAVGALAVGMYLLFWRPAPTVQDGTQTTPTITGGLEGAEDAGDRGTAPEETGETEESALPQADEVASGGATLTQLLTNVDVLSPTLTASGSIAYYDPTDGRFYTINDDGDVEKLAEARFPEAESVTFASDASAAVIEFPDGSNVIYGFDSGKQVTLPTHWEDFSFSGDASSVASKSIGTDASNRAIVITSADGSNTQTVAVLGSNDDKVDINLSPDNTIVAFSRTGGTLSGFGRYEYYLIGTDGEVVGNLIVEGTNFSAIWSPDGKYILYSVGESSNNERAMLWYADSKGDRNGSTRLRLGVATWVEKCTFASASTLYCAVPQEMVDGGGTTHSLVDSPDSLYKIDLPSGRTTLVGYPAADAQMFNLTLSDDGDTLYFQDEYGRINLMKLK